MHECYYFWPHSTLNHLIEHLNGQINNFTSEDHEISKTLIWYQSIKLILKSKTAWGYYGTLSFKKRKEWLYKFAQDLG